ncbi:MAG: TlpA family protein disulfide reductase [Calditerrivibrio sp.]|nr:TlpA family protein disulfide reductase [Calditerrivibrio sp.]MCA1933432.1 TlpA family protein disulfide reductase [Calditerrivibrio sp.]MCA1980850.1 TlpA family protein disulfide reductase [Calditerrivibrio sp.]
MKKLFFLLILILPIQIFATSVERIDELGFNKLLKQGQSKTVVIFWGVYCPYCKELLKTVNENKDFFNGQNIKVIAVSVDNDKKLVDNYAEKSNYYFKLYFDMGKLKRKYNAYFIPMTVIFDKNGGIEDTFPGNKTIYQLKELLKD